MRNYLMSLDRILTDGTDRPNRTGVDTRSYFGQHLEYDLDRGFPLLTTKKMASADANDLPHLNSKGVSATPWNSIVAELLWFISGSGDIRDLHKYGCHIWDDNTAAWNSKHKRHEHDAGLVYGSHWRNWRGAVPFTVEGESGTSYTGYEIRVIDQLEALVDSLRHNPYSRRHIVTAWNPAADDQVCLPACHILFQCNVNPPTEKGRHKTLDLSMYQRSCDMFLGVPFNIASYALLTHILAACTGMKVGRLIMNLGDTHIYFNHLEQVKEQIKRDPLRLPDLGLKHPSGKTWAQLYSDPTPSPISDLPNPWDFKPEHIVLSGYKSYGKLKGAMAV